VVLAGALLLESQEEEEEKKKNKFFSTYMDVEKNVHIMRHVVDL
jgi:hypothetical protein